jgi:hypothetical protein
VGRGEGGFLNGPKSGGRRQASIENWKAGTIFKIDKQNKKMEGGNVHFLMWVGRTPLPGGALDEVLLCYNTENVFVDHSG